VAGSAEICISGDSGAVFPGGRWQAETRRQRQAEAAVCNRQAGGAAGGAVAETQQVTVVAAAACTQALWRNARRVCTQAVLFGVIEQADQSI